MLCIFHKYGVFFRLWDLSNCMYALVCMYMDFFFSSIACIHFYYTIILNECKTVSINPIQTSFSWSYIELNISLNINVDWIGFCISFPFIRNIFRWVYVCAIRLSFIFFLDFDNFENGFKFFCGSSSAYV